MSRVYLGYYVKHQSKELFDIFVVGEDKKEAYERYCKVYDEVVVGEFPNLEKLPIEKFHYNDNLQDIDPVISEMIIYSDFPKVWFEGDTTNDEEYYDDVMDDDYIDNYEKDKEE